MDQLSKRKIKYIKKNYPAKSIDEIARDLNVPAKIITKFLATVKAAPDVFVRETEPGEFLKVSSAKRKIIFIGIIILLGFLVYANSLRNDFVWDDEYLIRDNAYITSFSHAGDIFKSSLGVSSGNKNNFYRPLQELSFMVDFSLWRNNVFGYHLTNVLFHILAGVFLFFILTALFRNDTVSFIVSLLFVVHPLNTEAVTYIAGRADPEYLFFSFLSLFLFVKWFQDSQKNIFIYLLSLAFFVCGMFSKELAVIMVLNVIVIVLFLFKEQGKLKKTQLLSCVWPYFVLAGVYIYLRLTILDFSKYAPAFAMGKVDLPLRILTTFKSIVVYLRLMLFPFGLHMERTISVVKSFFEPTAIGAVIFLGFFIWFILRWGRKNKIVMFGLAWFFINLLPVSNIVPVNAFISEHWVYSAAIGIFLIFAAGLFELAQKGSVIRRGIFVFFTFILIFFSVRTIQQNKVWKDEISFFENIIENRPQDSKIRLNLGNTYLEKGMWQKALEQYEAALKIDPDYAEVYNNIGVIYGGLGQNEKAIEYFQKALAIKPYSDASFNLALKYEKTGNTDEAMKFFYTAISQDPLKYPAYNKLAVLYVQKNNFQKAIELLSASLRIKSGQPDVQSLLDSLQKRF